jgi:C-terminal processing protease CtpA/Prc
VFVLAGRGSLSSNESFVAAMREIPQVTVVGDTTGGATANPVARPYLDGWKVWVSTWYATLPDGSPIEGRGIPPDIVLPFSGIGERDPVISAVVVLAGKS